MRPSISFTAAAALLLAFATAGCSRSAPASTVEAAAAPVAVVAPAVRRDLNRTLSLAAELRPFQQVALYAKEAGYVQQIRVDVGDRVQTGELLATLEIPELRDQLAQATATAQADQQDVLRAAQDLDRAEAAANVAHLDASRLTEVSKAQPNLVARQEVDAAIGADQEAAAQVSADKSALAAAKSRVAAAQQAQNQVSTLLSYARITAPFAGIITARYADKGTLLQAGVNSRVQAEPLVQLSQNDLLRLVIPVPESDVARIHRGESVEVRVPALNRTFPGVVARFADQLDLDTRTMHTEVDVPNPTLAMVPGMYAYADLVLDQARAAVAIPVAALIRGTQPGTGTVLVVGADRHIQSRNVTTGLETADQVQVLSGIAPGERVVIAGQASLKAGQLVTPAAN